LLWLNVYCVCSKQNESGNVATYISASVCLCGDFKWPTIMYVTRYTTPSGDEIFCICSDQPWGHPASCTMGVLGLSWGKAVRAWR